MRTRDFIIRTDWRGEPLTETEWVRGTIRIASDLRIRVEAPFHDDPAPPTPPGPTPRLWEYEVVELFLLGADDHYLEVELGPRGHHLVLLLHGRRNIVEQGLEIEYDARIDGGRWRGEARIAGDRIPAGTDRFNAYSICNSGSARRYSALHPVTGDAPDFHRLDCFGPLWG